MCIVCISWNKGELTPKEAMRNLSELINFVEDPEERDHYLETFEQLMEEQNC